MSTLLIEQQIYLLERYSSPEYFKLMRDAWNEMVEIGYAALDEFMLRLPPDYRSSPSQPDIVWGERVLPNLNRTADMLNVSYEKLLAGDHRALGASSSVYSDNVALSRDYFNGWMAESFQQKFNAKRQMAVIVNSGAYDTYQRAWQYQDLYYSTWEEETGAHWEYWWGILPPPKTWPIYRLNCGVQVKTDETVPQTGIYLPTLSKSCPEFMIAGTEAWEAEVGSRGNRSRQPTTWILVERVADEGGPEPGKEPWRIPAGGRWWRCEANQACPKEGYWWSYAAPDRSGRRHFRAGEIMPNFPLSTYGATIWYMTEGDEGPK